MRGGAPPSPAAAKAAAAGRARALLTAWLVLAGLLGSVTVHVAPAEAAQAATAPHFAASTSWSDVGPPGFLSTFTTTTSPNAFAFPRTQTPYPDTGSRLLVVAVGYMMPSAAGQQSAVLPEVQKVTYDGVELVRAQKGRDQLVQAVPSPPGVNYAISSELWVLEERAVTAGDPSVPELGPIRVDWSGPVLTANVLATAYRYVNTYRPLGEADPGALPDGGTSCNPPPQPGTAGSGCDAGGVSDNPTLTITTTRDRSIVHASVTVTTSGATTSLSPQGQLVQQEQRNSASAGSTNNVEEILSASGAQPRTCAQAGRSLAARRRSVSWCGTQASAA